MLNAPRRQLLALAAAAGALPATAQEAPAPPACSHCRARLQTVEALRAQLPATWQVGLEAEPVLGAQMLVLRAGPASAPPLLLVHGLGQNGFTDWLPVLPALARQWRVLAVDLPGFGYSPSAGSRLSPTQFARVLDGLLAREGRGSATVLGYSLGGAVALRLAADHATRVAALVLVNAAGILQRTAFSKHMAALPLDGVPAPLREPAARAREWGQRLIEQVFGLPVDPLAVLRDNDWLWQLVLRDRNSVNAALALLEENFSAAVHQVQQPVQVIWGEADGITPLRTGELLARRLPRAQLHGMPGIGHAPMAQAPQAFEALLLQVLAQAPAPPQALPAAGGTAPDLHCSGEFDRRYSGHYREVVIERCTGLQLTDVVAGRIVLRDSSVQMTGVQVQADDIAVEATRSDVMATACTFSGRLALRSDASRLDLAGVHLAARGFAVQVLGRSRLVASVSEIRDAWYAGWWHEDRTLDGEVLDPRSPVRRPATAAERD